ncbi:hypothetical protein [Streptomyces sp. NPDC055085]
MSQTVLENSGTICNRLPKPRAASLVHPILSITENWVSPAAQPAVLGVRQSSLRTICHLTKETHPDRLAGTGFSNPHTARQTSPQTRVLSAVDRQLQSLTAHDILNIFCGVPKPVTQPVRKVVVSLPKSFLNSLPFRAGLDPNEFAAITHYDVARVIPAR